MKYVDTSALLRVLFAEPGVAVPLVTGDRVASSELAEVEAFRAVDRERLLGNLDDAQTAIKRKELTDLLAAGGGGLGERSEPEEEVEDDQDGVGDAALPAAAVAAMPPDPAGNIRR